MKAGSAAARPGAQSGGETGENDPAHGEHGARDQPGVAALLRSGAAELQQQRGADPGQQGGNAVHDGRTRHATISGVARSETEPNTGDVRWSMSARSSPT